MKVLIAPNAFKNSLTAEEAGKAILEGLKESHLLGDFRNIPIADGGDGSLLILAKYLEAKLQKRTVTDPFGNPVTARFAINAEKKLGIIELAEASGLRRVDPDNLNPWIASTYGTGEIISEVIDQGCTQIILTVGGSATTDGGLGILKALGVEFFNEGESFAPTGPCDFHKIDQIDAAYARKKLNGIAWTVLADVENKLLGEKGCVKIYGPQKGIDEDELEVFEESMAHWESLLSSYTGGKVKDIEMGGASGGVPAALASLFNARLVKGSDYILEISGFFNELSEADVIITAEGTIDQQTGFGKGPGTVAGYGRLKGIPVIGLCGQIHDDYNPDESDFTAVFPINSKLYALNVAIARTRMNLKFTANQIGNLLAIELD